MFVSGDRMLVRMVHPRLIVEGACKGRRIALCITLIRRQENLSTQAINTLSARRGRLVQPGSLCRAAVVHATDAVGAHGAASGRCHQQLGPGCLEAGGGHRAFPSRIPLGAL